MSALSQKIRGVERQEIAVEGRKSAPSEKTAKNCLNYGGTTAEMWSAELEVGLRRIHKWRSGEEEIPESRYEEIIWKAKKLIMKQREAIEKEIEFWMRQAYGPQAKS